VNELPDWEYDAPVTVGVHVKAGTVLGVTLYPAAQRLVLDVKGRNQATLHLFLDRPDLVRLLEVMTAARDDLDAAMARLVDPAPGVDRGNVHGADRSDGVSGAVA
jgi:hypothetical protein